MKTAALLLSLAACGPAVRPDDCVSAGGMLVLGADCSEVSTMERRLSAEFAALGLAVPFDGATLEVLRDTTGKRPGETHCDARRIQVSMFQGWGEPLTVTAFAHEAFHLAQGCAWDADAAQACVDAHGKDCVQAGFHAGWSAEIYPAIDRVNGRGDL